MLQGGESQRPRLMVRIKLQQYVAIDQVQGTVTSDSQCVSPMAQMGGRQATLVSSAWN
jgi:hypothetical protein